MEEFLTFLSIYGWQLALIALAGIIILGILKYCNVFKKFDEKIRHVLYMIISVGISIIGAIIYLAYAHQLTVEYIFVIAGAILALNQTFYAIYDTTTLKDLFAKLLNWIKNLITSGKGQEIIDKIKEDTEIDQSEDQENNQSIEKLN